MTDEEKKNLLMTLAKNGVKIEQLNMGEGHQYFGCTIHQSTESDVQTIQPIPTEDVAESITEEPQPTDSHINTSHTSSQSPLPSEDQKMFKYISPFVTDEEERKNISKTVINLVNSNFRLSAICEQLKLLQKKQKIALYVSTTEQYNELARLGLPINDNGYSQKNYENYMSEQKK